MANVDRIASLLAMAERTDNAAEAEAFLTKAQTLATLHSVDLAMAQARIAKREQREQPINKQITIGERGKRANKHLVSLFSVVASSNDVVIDIARNSTYVIGYGMPSDLSVTEALWGSLAHQMVSAGNDYVAAREWENDEYLKYDRRTGRYESIPVTAQVARASFYRGFITRIGDRLAAARSAALREASENQPDPQTAEGTETPMALVLKAKSDEVNAHYKQASTARGSWGGYRGNASAAGRSGRAGKSAADSARLHAAKGIGSRAGSLDG